MLGRFALAVVVFTVLAPLERAPQLRSSEVWINTDRPITLRSLAGKVVLLDFWAFDCAPCIETLPRIQELEKKYSEDGLVVIGIHTPRAEYEKDVSKLREAMKRMGVSHPVIVDNKQKIWADYRCDLWPTQFVIDRKGFIRAVHGGVKRFEDVETAIQSALSEK